MGHGYIELPVDLDVTLGQPDAVSGQHPSIQHTGPRQDDRDRVPVLGGEPGALVLGLGQVDVEEGVELTGSFSNVDQAGQRDGVGGVGREAHLDAPVITVASAVEVGDRLGPIDPPLLGRLVSGQLKHPRGNQRTGAGSDHGVGQGVLEEVGLAGGGDPEAQQFGGGQAHPPEDILLGEVGLLGPENLVEPSVEGQVLPRSTEQGHGRVAVHIDQAGQQGAVYPDLSEPTGRPVVVGRRRPADMGDRVARYLHHSGPEHGPGLVARHHRVGHVSDGAGPSRIRTRPGRSDGHGRRTVRIVGAAGLLRLDRGQLLEAGHVPPPSNAVVTKTSRMSRASSVATSLAPRERTLASLCRRASRAVYSS